MFNFFKEKDKFTYKDRVDFELLKLSVKKLEIDMAKRLNPPKYKIGDKVVFTYTHRHIVGSVDYKCVVVGIEHDLERNSYSLTRLDGDGYVYSGAEECQLKKIK